MFDDIRKSLSAALYERTTSPLYGSLIITWSLWNWSILYLLFWDKSPMKFFERLDCIKNELYEPKHFFLYPIGSTILILTLGNLLASGAYWLQLKFDKWKIKQKEEMDSDKRLTIDESIMLRKEINQQQEFFQKNVTDKEVEISLLKKQLTETLNKNEPKVPTIEQIVQTDDQVKDEFKSALAKDEIATLKKVGELVSKVDKYQEWYKKLQGIIRSGSRVHTSATGEQTRYIPSELLEILESYNIIQQYSPGVYKFSDFGNAFNRYFIENLQK